ncbi:MAG: hypothetical protein LBT05_08965 [Planctomycetaceae bacterium]|jgi:hypothetical protein|nr:hypothetical protein [Planctomycetaceae bacterium]
MSKFCPHCGCEYGKEGSHDENAVICTNTGLPLGERNSPSPKRSNFDSYGLNESWNVGLFILFIFLTLIVPLVGIILGGMNLNSAKNTEGRRGQAITLLVLGIVMCIINAIIIIGNAANSGTGFNDLYNDKSENITIVKPLK